MKVTCDYCGSNINDTDEKCPNCGATNSNYKKVANSQPKTIEELKQWYIDKKLPPEDTTRFYIGKDVKKAKAFGIYKDEDTGKFIVYKNKADGNRAVRYNGDDEAYAVNEIYQKLRETIQTQKAHNVEMRSEKSSYKSYSKSTKKSSSGLLKMFGFQTFCYIAIIIFALLIEFFCGDTFDFIKNPERNKYYNYNGSYYYNLAGDYYQYDDGDWSYYGSAPFDEDNYKDYVVDNQSYSDYGVTDFKDTTYYSDWYEENHKSDSNSDSGWDSDSNWDSGDSWDSDYGSDWDSDW